MKDSLDTPVISRGNESDVFANRRLIRPTLRKTEAPRPENGERRERAERTERPANGLKVNREGEPNLLIYKPSIKYMYKENEEGDGK